MSLHKLMANLRPPLILRRGVAVLLAAGLVTVQAQLRAAAPQKPESPEVRSEETAPSFGVKAERNEVLVRVVIRDASGKLVGSLTKDDFRLYDDGKPQVVTVFSVEGSSAAAAGSVATKPAAPNPELEPTESAASTAQRYVAFYFDDLVMAFEDMVRTRDAAERYLQSSLQPTDRAGIITSSGLGVLDFTDDRAKLHEALSKLQPRPKTVRGELDCPPLSPYEGYLIVELHDQEETEIATQKVIQCACGGDPTHCLSPQQQAEAAAARIWQDNEDQSRQSLRVLANLVRRLGTLPGQRNILWISPGFLAITLQHDLGELTERALRNRVVINALDARGLWVLVPGGNASEHGSGSNLGSAMAGRLANIEMTAQQRNDDVMAVVAHDTGGVFFHNSNDYDGGFRKAGALPEFSYLLGFSPQNLKYNGKYHKLKVELVDSHHYSVQARQGYYAPNRAVSASQRAKEEIEQAVFSQDELHELPVEVQTQFFKLNELNAKLSVTARVDLRSIHFRREGDRNLDELKLVFAVFDRDGKLVVATQKNLELRLRDASLTRFLRSGLSIKTSFDVNAGTYLLRVVVHEAESAQFSALSRTVEIPY
jgi:VWFA-related protein